MKKNDVLRALELLGAEPVADQSRTGWVISDCVLGPWNHTDGKSSKEVFGVKLEEGDPFCSCFSCGYHGSMTDLVFRVRHNNKVEFNQKYKFGDVLQLIAQAEESAELDLNTPDIEEVIFGGTKNKVQPWPDEWLMTFPSWDVADWSKDYLKGRGVTPELADRLELKADTEQRRICFPIRDFSGRLVGLHGRAVDNGVVPRYRMYTFNKRNNPIVWLGESWVDMDKPVVIVEGPFDLMSVMRVYSNVVSPLFASLSKAKMLRMSDALEWVTFLDNGTGGDKGREAISKYMGSQVVNDIYPPNGRDDPGECSVEDLEIILSDLL